MRHFSARQLHEYLQQAEHPPLLLDVREPWEFEICSLHGSVLVPMSQIQGALSSLDPDHETVVICHHGIRSRRVAAYLEQVGFLNVINLSGGVDAWARDVDPEMAVY